MALLTKTELIAIVAKKTNSTKASTDRFITALQETIIESVADGDEVKLTGFAAFESIDRSARDIHNPKTGEIINVPAKRVPNIRPLSVFRSKVNGEADEQE